MGHMGQPGGLGFVALPVPMECVAIGSMIVMAGVALSQAWKDAFGSRDRGQGRSR